MPSGEPPLNPRYELHLPAAWKVLLVSAAFDLVLLLAWALGLERAWVSWIALLGFGLLCISCAAWIGAILFFGKERYAAGLGYCGVLLLQGLVLLWVLSPPR